MDIVNFIENEDGSATLTADIDKDELSMLVSYSVNDLIRKHIEHLKEQNGKL